MPRALFFPSYRGGGFGHVGRCLALAEEMARRGWENVFALGGPHANRVAAEGWSVFHPPSVSLPVRLRRQLGSVLFRSRPRPAYLSFSDLNFKAIRDGYHTTEAIQREVEWGLDVVSQSRPHVLVGDAWLLTSTVGHLTNIPVVQIIRSAAHPACPQLVWWRPVSTHIRSPNIAPVFNTYLSGKGLSLIQRAEDLLDGDLLIVPSIPELDPLPPDVERTHYVGPLVRSGKSIQQVPDYLVELPSDRPVLYVTVGGGSDSVRALDLLPLWNTAFADTGWDVIISTGGQVVPRRMRMGRGMRALPWVPGPAMIDCADVVLFHGGYGTMMETVQTGTPSVVIPFHTEQEGNGRRLEHNGAARVLAPGDDDLEPVEGRWGGGSFVTLTCSSLPFQPHQVQDAVAAVLHDDRFHTCATHLQHRQAAYRGVAAAAELILTLVIL